MDLSYFNTKSLTFNSENEFNLNQLNMMPVFELRSLNRVGEFSPEFDVLLDDGDLQKTNTLRVDYEKVKRYIQFQVNVMTSVKDTTTYQIAEFKICSR